MVTTNDDKQPGNLVQVCSLNIEQSRLLQYDLTHSTFEYLFPSSRDGLRPTLLEHCQTLRLGVVSDFPFLQSVHSTNHWTPAHVTQPWLQGTMDICETHTWSSQPPPQTYLKEHQSKSISCSNIYLAIGIWLNEFTYDGCKGLVKVRQPQDGSL